MKFNLGDRVVTNTYNPNLYFSGIISGFVSGIEEGLVVVDMDYVNCGYLYDNNNLKKGFVTKTVVHMDHLIKEDLALFI